MENESNGQTRMGINYKGSQGQAERAVALKEEEGFIYCTGNLCYDTLQSGRWLQTVRSNTELDVETNVLIMTPYNFLCAGAPKQIIQRQIT